MQEPKSLFASKTFWTNVIAMIVVLVGVFGIDLNVDPETEAELAAGFVAIVNVINILIRIITKTPVTVPGVNRSPPINGLVLACLVMSAIAVSACSTVPETPRERYAAVEATFTAAVRTATAAYEQGYIKPDSDLEVAIDRAIQTVSAALDGAGAALVANNDLQAGEWLDIAERGLAALQATIKEVPST